jgi:hypothetical protein
MSETEGITTEKKCARCGEIKDFKEFGKNNSCKDRFMRCCRSCVKLHRAANRERIREYNKKYNSKNKEKHREHCRKYYRNHKERCREYSRKSYKKRLGYPRKNYEKNAERRARKYKKDYIYLKQRRERDPIFAARLRLRVSVAGVFARTGARKTSKTFALLGCSAQELLDRWGISVIEEGQHLDHICPISQAQTVEEAEKLCHYTNLQLLSAKENTLKQDAWTERGEELCRQLLGREWIYK